MQALWPSALLQKPNTEATAGALGMAKAVGLPLGITGQVIAAVTPHTVSASGIACMKSDTACNMQIHGNASGWQPVRTNFATGCTPSVGAAEVRIWACQSGWIGLGTGAGGVTGRFVENGTLTIFRFTIAFSKGSETGY